jgi:nicotinamidase-related amidase
VNLPPLLQPDTAVLLVVDVQDRLFPTIHDGESKMEVMCRMVRTCRILQVPILLTEQYPAGIGPTCAPLRTELGDLAAVEKTRFSACVETVVDRLAEQGHPQVIVCGIEAHICVQQSVLDLLRLGYTPYVCADAIGSRRPLDLAMAIERMRQAGAVVTTSESVMFELMGEAGTDVFKQILKLVK